MCDSICLPPDEFETPLEGGVHPEDSFQTFNLVGAQFRPPDLLPLLVILDAVHEEFRCRLSATAALGMVHQTGHCKLQLQQVRRLSAPSLLFRRDAIKDQIVQVLLGGCTWLERADRAVAWWPTIGADHCGSRRPLRNFGLGIHAIRGVQRGGNPM